ncbi:hypothetical protein AX774_g2970 [Zancudomyces culisetae]|uniref:Uncharacterized protein n=1 Tax=Zancudomyces culisetae TaxID=1213189 RepID=A0A1R1PRL3_ZANCU|nr:hypothetical protein AX774_g2970 [Zancudomyces culisetae]|eukprot:OMH83522.1 hypothetical protein AX774_g2970 [Zancudomyces culisetae]
MTNNNEKVDYKLNNVDSNSQNPPQQSLEIEMFSSNYLKDKFDTIAIQPGACYGLPNINSCMLDGGKPGEGTIKFCTGNNCDGKCHSGSRKTWLYPQHMLNDIGGSANSVIWTI